MFVVSLLLASSFLFAETVQTQSAQRLNVEISNVALDYIPDVALVFDSESRALLPGNIGNFYSTKIYLTLESLGKTATHLISTLEFPYRNYSDEGIVYKNINSFTLRLWDIYAAAIKNGISPSQLKVKLKIIKHDKSEFQYDLTPVGTLEEMSLNIASKLLNDQYKQLPLRLTVKMIGYRAKLFDKIWGWKDLLPPSHLMSASFLSQYAKAKRVDSKGDFNINDLLDLFYAYSSGVVHDENFAWPSNSALESGSRTKQKELIQYVAEKTVKTNIQSPDYWADLVAHFYQVEKVINFDLSAQRFEVERVLNTEYPQAEVFQIVSSSTTNVVNNISVNTPKNSPAPVSSATEDYYRYRLAREKTQQAAENIRATLDLFSELRENLPNILFRGN